MQTLIKTQQQQIELLQAMLETMQQGNNVTVTAPDVQVVTTAAPATPVKKVSAKTAKKLTLVKEHLINYPDDVGLSSRKLAAKVSEASGIKVSHTLVSQVLKEI